MGTFVRLVSKKNAESKEQGFFEKGNQYIVSEREFLDIPGQPYVYWLPKVLIDAFQQKKIGEIAAPKVGLQTGENNRFIRLWFEVAIERICFDAASKEEAAQSGKKWFPYNKGGEYRKWYGNNDYIVNWENDGKEIRNFYGDNGKLKSRPQNTDAYFKQCITWSKISGGDVSFRFKPHGHIFDVAGTSIFANEDLLFYLQGFCNSKVALSILNAISPTINYEVGHIASLPVIVDEIQKGAIETLVKENIGLSKDEWDSFEISWDFKKHPLLGEESISIGDAFKKWEESCASRRAKLKSNEEELNSLFAQIYNVEQDLNSSIDEERISLRNADELREIQSLISYAVGCIFGRYSLKQDGLVYAGGKWDESCYLEAFKPCEYGVMPITEEQFFEEDLCTKVIDFIRVVFGQETLNDNLKYIASVLKPDSFEAPKKIIREYLFYDFFDNHYQIYQHRPIYWQLDSGKAGGFRAIVYMHRFTENTLPLVRTEFIQDLRYKYEEEMQRQKGRLEGASSTAEANAIKKDIATLDKKIVECAAYDELLNHATSSIQNYLFDLDDGVKTNYAKFLSIDGDKNSNILTVVKL